jgi:hypothetical protein
MIIPEDYNTPLFNLQNPERVISKWLKDFKKRCTIEKVFGGTQLFVIPIQSRENGLQYL